MNEMLKDREKKTWTSTDQKKLKVYEKRWAATSAILDQNGTSAGTEFYGSPAKEGCSHSNLQSMHTTSCPKDDTGESLLFDLVPKPENCTANNQGPSFPFNNCVPPTMHLSAMYGGPDVEDKALDMKLFPVYSVKWDLQKTTSDNSWADWNNAQPEFGTKFTLAGREVILWPINTGYPISQQIKAAVTTAVNEDWAEAWDTKLRDAKFCPLKPEPKSKRKSKSKQSKQTK